MTEQELISKLQEINIQYHKCEMLYNLASFYKFSGFFKLDIVKKYTRDIPLIQEEIKVNKDVVITDDDIYQWFRKLQWKCIVKIRENFNPDFKYENDRENEKAAISEVLNEVNNEIAFEESNSKGEYNINLIRLKDLKNKISETYCK